MGQITVDQSHQVVATLLQNTDWGLIDFDLARLQDGVIRNPKEAGRQFTAFLKNSGRVVVGDSRMIPIIRGRFNPAQFIGTGWSILTQETDTRSASLTELDFTKVGFVDMLEASGNGQAETRIKGEEKLRRLKKAGYIRLDAAIFFTLWEKQYLIPESWKQKVNDRVHYIFFEGTILRDSRRHRHVLFLYWFEDGWHWDLNWLGHNWSGNFLSAVLPR